MGESGGKKVAWNASEGIIMELTRRRSMANSFFINGNISKSINTLIAVKQSVIQSVLKDERKLFEDLEERFLRIAPYLSSSYSTSFNPKERELYSKAYSIALKIYSKYNETLMDLLEEREYLIGEKVDSSIMKF